MHNHAHVRDVFREYKVSWVLPSMFANIHSNPLHCEMYTMIGFAVDAATKLPWQRSDCSAFITPLTRGCCLSRYHTYSTVVLCHTLNACRCLPTIAIIENNLLITKPKAAMVIQHKYPSHTTEKTKPTREFTRLQTKPYQAQSSQQSYIQSTQSNRSLNAEQINRSRIACCRFSSRSLKLHTSTVPPLVRQPQRRESAGLRLQLTTTTIEPTRRKREQIS